MLESAWRLTRGSTYGIGHGLAPAAFPFGEVVTLRTWEAARPDGPIWLPTSGTVQTLWGQVGCDGPMVRILNHTDLYEFIVAVHVCALFNPAK